MNCPKCDAEMEYESAEPDVGVLASGWRCDACELFVPEWDVDNEP